MMTTKMTIIAIAFPNQQQFPSKVNQNLLKKNNNFSQIPRTGYLALYIFMQTHIQTTPTMRSRIITDLHQPNRKNVYIHNSVQIYWLLFRKASKELHSINSLDEKNINYTCK